MQSQNIGYPRAQMFLKENRQIENQVGLPSPMSQNALGQQAGPLQ